MFALVEVGSGTDDELPCPHGIPADLCEDLCPDDIDDADTTPVVDLDRLPGARLALDCEAAGSLPALLTDGQILDVVEGTERLLRWAMGLRTRMLAEFADRHPAGSSAAPPGADPTAARPVGRWLPDEVGLTLGISPLEALSQIARAQRLAHVLPDTLAALEHGHIDERRADAVAHLTAVLPDDKARAVEAAVLPNAPAATPRQLRDRVRRAVARVDPDGEHRRHQQANTERRASVRSLEDGMASLWFYGPAEQIEAAWQMADRLARALGPHDPRTLDQRRFDVALQILQGRLSVTDLTDVDTAVTTILNTGHDEPERSGTGQEPDTRDRETGRPAPDPAEPDPAEPDPGDRPVVAGPPDPSGSGPVARIPPDVLTDAVVRALAQRPDPHRTIHTPLIHVVVGIDTLLGDDHPAELVGHGPIPARTARALAADGVWKRLVTDPLSGTLLDHGRTTYAPPAGLADHVRARDHTCRGPHCTRRIGDLDHHRSWAHGGTTDEPNLHGYCRHHHKLKDAPGWQVLAHPDGSLTWISPHGRRHTTTPYDHRPFTDTPTPAGHDTGAPPPTEIDDEPPPF